MKHLQMFWLELKSLIVLLIVKLELLLVVKLEILLLLFPKRNSLLLLELL